MPKPATADTVDPKEQKGVIDVRKLRAIRTVSGTKYRPVDYAEFFFVAGSRPARGTDTLSKALNSVMGRDFWYMINKDGEITVVPTDKVEEYFFAA